MENKRFILGFDCSSKSIHMVQLSCANGEYVQHAGWESSLKDPEKMAALTWKSCGSAQGFEISAREGFNKRKKFLLR